MAAAAAHLDLPGDLDAGQVRPPHRPDRHGLPVYLAVDPVVKGTPWTTLQRTAEVTDWETGQFGPYPFSATGGVVDDAATVGYALETATKPMYDRAPDLPTGRRTSWRTSGSATR